MSAQSSSLLPTRSSRRRCASRCARSRSATAPATPAGRRAPPAGIRPLVMTARLLRDESLNEGLAFFGGPYNNHLALRAAIADARRRGAAHLFCLGDLGGFGPNPGKI